MKKRIAILIIALSVLLFLNARVSSRGFVRIHFINVGSGDAILIQSGNEAALIDAGGLLKGYELVEYLKKNRVSEIKYFILTHPHFDHIYGAFFILPKFKVQHLYDNGKRLPNDYVYDWYRQLVRENPGYAVLRKGSRLKLKDVSLDILWPAESGADFSNENSLVIRLSSGKFNCLFAGDLNKTAEEKLLAENQDLKANILKVGHHGYDDATSGEFLQAVSPEVALISIRPRVKEYLGTTLEALNKKNVRVYRTDSAGNIVVTADNSGNYKIKTEREDPGR